MEKPGYIAHEMTIDVDPRDSVTIEKVVTLVHLQGSLHQRTVGRSLPRCRGRIGSFNELLDAHTRDWNHLWKRFLLDLEDDGGMTLLALRLHIFHLLQTTSRNTLDLDVGRAGPGACTARRTAATCSGTSCSCCPSSACVSRRSSGRCCCTAGGRLPRPAARPEDAGHAGAMYPWQSGSDGREETQLPHLNPRPGRWLPDNSRHQRHVGLGIAYNVWQYYQSTGDLAFLATRAEMLLEIGRFWAGSPRSTRPPVVEIGGSWGRTSTTTPIRAPTGPASPTMPTPTS